jgi:hypothetical protein
MPADADFAAQSRTRRQLFPLSATDMKLDDLILASLAATRPQARHHRSIASIDIRFQLPSEHQQSQTQCSFQHQYRPERHQSAVLQCCSPRGRARPTHQGPRQLASVSGSCGQAYIPSMTSYIGDAISGAGTRPLAVSLGISSSHKLTSGYRS